jgi:anti-anti-sigma regulatory factor
MAPSPDKPAAVSLRGRPFSHKEADAILRWALRRDTARTVVIDLSHATDATTAAFATLVLLRRRLLRDGRDLRVDGLRDRAQHVFDVNRLHAVLPVGCN